MPQENKSDKPGLSYSDLFSNRDFINLGGDDPIARHDAWVEVLSSYPEWKRTPKAKQDEMLIDLQRLYQGQEGITAPTPGPYRGPSALAPGARSVSPRGAVGSAITEVGGAVMGPGELVYGATQHPLKSAVTFGKEFVAQPLRELAGQPQPGENEEEFSSMFPADPKGFHRPPFPERALNFMDSLVGGNPEAARESTRAGDTTGAYAHLLTIPLLTFGLGKLLELPRKPVSPTRREISSLQDISGGVVKGTGPESATGRMAEVQKLLKQSMVEMGINDSNIAQEIPIRGGGRQADLVGNIARGNQKVLDIAKNAVEIAHRPIDTSLKLYGNNPAGVIASDISNDLISESRKIGKVNPALGKEVYSIARRIADAKTLNNLNEIKSYANKLVNDIYSPIPGQAIDATAERAFAYKLAADAIRARMYPELQRLSGDKINLSKVGQREADAIAMRDGLHEHYYREVAPEQVSKEASGFLEYTLAAQGAPGHSLYSRHILARGLEKSGVIPSVGGRFSKLAGRGIGPVGEGMRPERVKVTSSGGKPSVTLGGGAPGLGGTTHSISMGGQVVGSITYSVSGDTLTIHHFGGPQRNYNALSNVLGPIGLSQVAQQVVGHNPNIKYIQGVRVGGAQGAAGKSVRVSVSKLKGGTYPGISIIPYKPGRVPRFPHATRNLLVGARGARAAEGAVKKLTPPPELPEDEDEDQP